MMMMVMAVVTMMVIAMIMLVMVILQTFLLSHRCHECCPSAPTRRGFEQGNCRLPLHCHRDEDEADYDQYERWKVQLEER